MKSLFLGGLCALVLACASSPPDVLAHPDGLISASLNVAVDSALQPFTLASLEIVAAPAHAIVAPADSEVRTGDTGERSPDSGRPVSLPVDVIAGPSSPHATLRDTLNRLHRSDTLTSARVLRIDRDPSRIGGAVVHGLRPARG